MHNPKALLPILFSLALVACGSSPNWDGYSPAEASKLQAQGINAEQAAAYREMGFTSGTIQSWYDAGIKSQQNIIVWHDARFSATEAGAWSAAGFVPVDAYEWRKKDFDAADAQRWRDSGHSLRDASKKRNKGLSPDST